MAHKTLYRAFRPATFDDVSGQSQVTDVLRKEIENQTPGHAFLFCGSRGTGKTTTARILANALNCLEPVNGNPCGQCEACRMFAEDRFVDIVEIDAASNNGVDSIRDLREKAALLPVQGKYKVYIIDEVHMLSSGAFNALLKTLEEPPPHTVFILATTELRKVPKTIVSRCQRFEFRRIGRREIVSRLEYVAAQIGVKADPEALGLIADQADGALRDALSLFEQCAAGRETLTKDDVLESLGLSDSEVLSNLCQGILSGDTGAAMSALCSLTDGGTSQAQVLQDMVTCLSGMLAKDAQAGADVRKLVRALDILISSQASLRYSSVPQAVILTAIVKAANLSADPPSLTDMELRLQNLEEQVESLKRRPPAPAPQPAPAVQPTASVQTAAPVQQANAEKISRPAAGKNAVKVFRQYVSQTNPPMAPMARSVRGIAQQGNTGILRVREEDKFSAEVLVRDARPAVLLALAQALGTAVAAVRIELVPSPEHKSEVAEVLETLKDAFGKDKVIEIDD